MKEEWRDIKGYEGRYQISNLGRVYSIYKKDCLKLCVNKDGYIFISLSKEGKRNYFLVHRLVAEAFIPNPNNYKEINHKDENKANNCVENLEWCTHKYNMSYGTRTQRARKNISLSTKGKSNGRLKDKHPMYGKHHTEEARKKIADSVNGSKMEEQEKYSVSQQEKYLII